MLGITFNLPSNLQLEMSSIRYRIWEKALCHLWNEIESRKLKGPMGSLYFHAGIWPALDCGPDSAGSGSCYASLSPSSVSLGLQWDMPEVSHHLWGYSCMCCPKVRLKEFCPKGLHLDWQGNQNQWINNVLFLHLGGKLGVMCQKAPQIISGDRAHLLE